MLRGKKRFGTRLKLDAGHRLIRGPARFQQSPDVAQGTASTLASRAEDSCAIRKTQWRGRRNGGFRLGDGGGGGTWGVEAVSRSAR